MWSLHTIMGIKAVGRPVLRDGDSSQQSPDRDRTNFALPGNIRPLVGPVLVAAAYYAGTKIGFAITPASEPISTLWPPNAILFAALLLSSARSWWTLLLAVLPVHFAVQLASGVPPLTALGWYGTNASEALVGAAILRLVNKGEPLFDRLSGVINFMIFGVLVAPFVTTFLDAAVVVLTGWGRNYWHLWHMRLFSNMLANLLIVPPIVILGSMGLSSIRQATLRTRVELALLAAGILVIGKLVLGAEQPPFSTIPALIYMLLPILLWAAMRFGPAAVSGSLLAVATLAIWNAIHGHGPFSSGTLSENVFTLQVFLGVTAVPMLTLAAVVQERRQIVQALRTNEEWLKLDIAQRQAAEKQIIETQMRYEMATAAAGVAVWEWNQITNSAYFDPVLPRMLGYAPEESQTHEDWLRRIDVEDRPHVESTLNGLTAEKPDLDLEYRVHHRNGELRWVHHRGTLHEEAGMRRVVGTLTDITTRKLALLALAESEQRFRQTADAAPIMVWMSTPSKGCTYVSRAWTEFTGRSLEAELGDGWLESVHPADRKACWGAFRSNVIRRQPSHIEYRVRRRDGEYRWVLDHGVPRFDNDGIFLGFIGSAVDITDRKRSEETARDLSGKLIQAQEEERRRIARELHDDVGQRLAVLSIELDKFRGKLNASLRSRASKLWNQASQISQTVRDISHDLHSPGLDWLSLGPALKALLEDFGQQHSLAVSFSEGNVPAEVPQEIKLTFYRVTQEALQNVTKHSGAHSVAVELKAYADQLSLQISDDGVGFGPEQRPVVGLGLASMRERLRSVGGVMTITSAHMQGTKLEALVPLHPPVTKHLNGAA